MKDNYPNYLNPHNIDPAHVSPASNHDVPGFDSIRPGMNIGTVAVVGKGRPKLQLPTMSNAEAIEVLKHLEADIYGRIAIAKAIDALIGPWVKTSDRAPTMEDADAWDLVFATHRAFGGEPYKVRYQVVANNPSDHVWWMPIPPLPEPFARGHEKGDKHADK